MHKLEGERGRAGWGELQPHLTLLLLLGGALYSLQLQPTGTG